MKICGIVGMMKLEIGFWHPFGPHAGETAEQILDRKAKEIQKNGWTLWSFQFRNSLKEWFDEIEKAKPQKVYVFCSEGRGARDPISEKKYCNQFKFVNQARIQEIPPAVKVPHPMGQKTGGSAFVVEKIIYPSQLGAQHIEWLKGGQWQTSALPTRPEYLIRSGRGQAMRPVKAILELKYPYLAEVFAHSKT